MTLALIFTATSMLVGLAQAIDAVVLFKNRGIATRGTTLFSLFEYFWALVCVGIIFSSAAQSAQSSRWLAMAFLAYVPTAIAVAFLSFPRMWANQTGNVQIPMISVYFGGLFGVIYALASLALLNVS